MSTTIIKEGWGIKRGSMGDRFSTPKRSYFVLRLAPAESDNEFTTHILLNFKTDTDFTSNKKPLSAIAIIQEQTQVIAIAPPRGRPNDERCIKIASPPKPGSKVLFQSKGSSLYLIPDKGMTAEWLEVLTQLVSGKPIDTIGSYGIVEPFKPDSTTTDNVLAEDEFSYGQIEPFDLDTEEVENTGGYGVVDVFTTKNTDVEAAKAMQQTHVVADESSLYLGVAPDNSNTTNTNTIDNDNNNNNNNTNNANTDDNNNNTKSEPASSVYNGEDKANFEALYPYKAANFDEIDGTPKDTFCITEVWPDGWDFGKNLKTNKIGLIPGNFLIPIESKTGAPEPPKPKIIGAFPE